MSLGDYVTLGRSGLRVSPLALGTMTFGTSAPWGVDESKAATIFDRYIDHGGNFFDTANSYQDGQSEEILGKLVRERSLRDRAVIATKFARTIGLGNPNGVGNGRKLIYASLEQSLRRLQTDYVDLYWLHSWDTYTPAEEIVDTLDSLVRVGKIRYYGFSDVPAWFATRAQTLAEKDRRAPLVGLQLEYSLIERAIEREHIPAAQELGLAVTAWGTTASGLLAGKYRRRADGTFEGTRDGVTPRSRLLSSEFAQSGLSDRHWHIADLVTHVAEQLGVAAAQVALNWVATQPGSTAPIFGATSPEQVDQNVAALDLDIPAERRAELDHASALALDHPYRMYKQPTAELFQGGVSTTAWQPAPFTDR